MTAEEKKTEMSQNLAKALKPPKLPENLAKIDPVTRKEFSQKTLAELTVEIKFHLKQMGWHAIEVGRLLIEAKEQVGHGEWLNWLEENFKLKKSSAENLMKIAERFGSNSQSIGNLNYTQMVQMLSLPAGEEEKFIEEKTAEGKAVEDMTVKTLRAEIKEWTEKYKKVEEERNGYRDANEILDAQNENLNEENTKLIKAMQAKEENENKLLGEYADLQEDKMEMQSQIEMLKIQIMEKESKIVEVAPADYDQTKKELTELKETKVKLEAELKEMQERPIEVAIEKPADYEEIKAENAELKKQQENVKNEYMAAKKLEEIFSALPYLMNYLGTEKVIEEVVRKEPERIGKKIAQMNALELMLKKSYEEIYMEEQK